LGNFALFGAVPVGWHLTSACVHVAVTLFAYLVALALALALALSRERCMAGATALLFGVHPVHIEPVAWITGVIDPLVALFFTIEFSLLP
jgi:hypothetical protein